MQGEWIGGKAKKIGYWFYCKQIDFFNKGNSDAFYTPVMR